MEEREGAASAPGAWRHVTPDDPAYPGGLRDLPGTPPGVYLAGPWTHDGAVVAVVGSRSATGDGCDVAYALARGLAAHGVAVVSGLARGVDAAAHRGALDAGGRSGAVLGTGPDRCYPKEHRELQDSLARSLGLMTELPPGAAPTRSTFAARNRLLAAISSAVVLVQGRTGSGALLTVEAARRMARPVGAIPWDSREPLGHAPHALIRARTAVLVRDAADVLELIAATASASAAARAARPVADAGPPASDAALGDLEFDPRHALGERETRLFRALRHHPRPLDEAAERAGLPASEAGAAFVILELQGLARRDPGGVVRLTRRA